MTNAKSIPIKVLQDYIIGVFQDEGFDTLTGIEESVRLINDLKQRPKGKHRFYVGKSELIFTKA